MAALASQLKENFQRHDAAIGVVGLGYVGLPLAMVCADRGFVTVGFDTDEQKIRDLENGRSYILTIASEAIAAQFRDGKAEATSDFTRLAEVDAIIICVPTPLAHGHEPDLRFVEATAETICKYLRAGQLVILESTTYPGTSEEILKPILERSGLKSGVDFFLAYSPEREDPGNQSFKTDTIPKIVGGDGADALDLACTLYDELVVETIPVSSLGVAEAAKLTENIFRSVNIALVNELKIIYDKMGIDVWQVIDAAKSKPFGYMPFYPGPGLGGHCIPIDPFYLTWRAKKFGIETRFIELAGEINSSMPEHVVEVLTGALSARNQTDINGAKILLLGLAYKKNVNDTRESPAFKLIELMETAGAEVDYYDPHVPEILAIREYPSFAGRKSIAWSPGSFQSYDAVLICTDHDAVDYADVVANAKLVVDTRNATHGLDQAENIVVKA